MGLNSNHKDLVSIIIPTFNRAHTIARAIDSALKQTHTNIEVIVVDDGSTDNTEAITRSFEVNDNRIKYINLPENGGGSKARNEGLRHAQGEYVAFLDSDDEWLPGKLEKQLQVFQTSAIQNLGFVNCGTVYIDEAAHKVLDQVLDQKTGSIFREMLLHKYATGGGSSNLIRKNVFDKCGFFDESVYLQKGKQDDYEMWLRISKSYSFDCAPEFLVKRYFHATNASSVIEMESRAEAFEYIMGKFKDDYMKYSKVYSGYFRYLGTQYTLNGKEKKGRQRFRMAIGIQPLDPRNYIHFFMSLFGQTTYSLVYKIWAYERIHFCNIF